jgi:glycosyltransferase involved in cell wall biosynthesis
MNLLNTRPKIIVCIPAYNEELTIVATIKSFHKELPEAEIWVINNYSNDKTEELAKQLFIELGCKGGVLNEGRKGKGNALRRGFLELDADIYLVTDADFTYPAERARDLIAPISNGYADMVVGDRLSGGHYGNENKRPFHSLGNKLVCKLVNYLFRAELLDIMSGYRAFNRRFVKSYPILVEGFEIEVDMTIHALDKRFRILEIPIEYKDRPIGSFSKLNTLSDGKRVLLTIAKIFRYYRPLVFFFGMAIFFGLAGLITAIPVFEDWITKRYIFHVPLAILSAGLEIVASLMLCVGLILDSNANQNRAIFEQELLRMD